LDLARAWREAALTLLALDEAEDVFLPLREHVLFWPLRRCLQVHMNTIRRR
jgi:hypothetical protein